MKKWIILAAAALVPHVPTAEAHPQSIMLCAENSGLYSARANITVYTRGETGPESRRDTGWQDIGAGGRFCINRVLVRAYNVTIQAWNGSQYLGVCDENRRESNETGYVRSAIVTARGDLVQRRCSVLSP